RRARPCDNAGRSIGMTRALRWIVPLALALPSCGRTPAAPSAPPTPSPTPAPPLQAVGVIVFYDENGNGVLDRDEQARIPDVDVDTDRRGYRQRLQDKLQAHVGQGEVTNQGGDATSSRDGVARAATALRKERSAYTLIHYGTNDWNDALCQTAVSSCFTIQSLQTIVRDVKDAGSLPVLATIIPANPSLNPPERNAWVSQVD